MILFKTYKNKMSKKFLAEMKKIEYNKMIGLINNEQKREYETDLRIAFLLKKEEKSIIKKEPRQINKYETGKYINSQSLNYIYN
jgi:hypothetical protein